MIIKILNKLWFCLLLVFLSCSNDDNEALFDEAPAVRIEQRITELQTLLQASPNGYKAVYFTKNDEYGGFTFFMKFNNDGTVDMTSDFDDQTAITSSRYDVKMGTTTELVFSTRNHIHKVSDSNINNELRGSGYEGNSNFQYVKNENGNIIFKEARQDATIVFEPASAADWDSVTQSLARRGSILPTPTSSVFQGLTIENASGTKKFYSFDYDTLRLFANSTFTAEDGSLSEISFGIAYTPDGLIVSPPIEVDGISYEEFTFEETSRSFVSVVGGNNATIGFLNQPAFISNDILDIGDRFTIYLYRPSLGTDPRTSPAFNAVIDQINTNIAGFGFTFFQFTLNIDPDGADGDTTLELLFFDAGGAPLFLTYSLKPSIVDKKLFFEYLGPLDGNSDFLAPQMQPLIDFCISTEGLFYETTGNFQTFSNRAGTFVSGQDTSLRVYGLWF